MRFRFASGLVGAVALSTFFGAFGASSGSDGPIGASQAVRAATVAALPANKLPPHPLRTPPFTPRPTPTARPILIYVLFPNRVNVYPSWAYNGYPPIATLQGSHTRLRNASELAFDAAGKLYVLNQGSLSVKPSITVYAPNPKGNMSPVATISGAKTGLTANYVPANDYHASNYYFAVGATGTIYVTHPGAVGSVYVFRASANGNVAPTAIIGGPKTGLTYPTYVAVDGAGRVYVLTFNKERTGNTVRVFAASASGNVRPIATIAGSKTSLMRLAYDGWSAMAVSPSGRLYVEAYQIDIAVFAPGANGNVSPVRQLGNFVAVSMAPDYLGRLYVLDSFGSIVTFAADANDDPAPLTTFKVARATGGEKDASTPDAWAIAVR